MKKLAFKLTSSMRRTSIAIPIAILALGLAAGAAKAQQFSVATGAKAGTYSMMFNQLSDQCQQAVGAPFVERATTGSNENPSGYDAPNMNRHPFCVAPA